MTAVAILAQGKSRHNESFFSKTYRGSEDGRQAPTRQPETAFPPKAWDEGDVGRDEVFSKKARKPPGSVGRAKRPASESRGGGC